MSETKAFPHHVPRVLLEGPRAWHDGMMDGSMCRSPMRRVHGGTIKEPDGTTLYLVECVAGCGRAYVGIDSRNLIRQRPATEAPADAA